VLLPLENRAGLLHFVSKRFFGRSGMRSRVKEFVLRTGAKTGLWAQLASDFAFVIRKA
jgi:hypothetical protein